MDTPKVWAEKLKCISRGDQLSAEVVGIIQDGGKLLMSHINNEIVLDDDEIVMVVNGMRELQAHCKVSLRG